VQGFSAGGFAMNRPSSGSMVYWKFKNGTVWYFGYVTYAGGCDLLRMGVWNGDSIHGSVVSISEIEWRPYKR